MRAKGKWGVNALVVLLSATYLFIALSYISFLPSYAIRTPINRTHTTMSSGKYGSSNNAHPLLQKFFKSTTESKKEPVISPGIAILFVTVVVSALAALTTTIKPRDELAVYAILHRWSYLHYHSFRI